MTSQPGHFSTRAINPDKPDKDAAGSLFRSLRTQESLSRARFMEVERYAVVALLDAAEALAVLLDPDTITGSWAYTQARAKGHDALFVLRDET